MIDVEGTLNKIGVRLTEQLVNDIRTKLLERKGVDGNFQSVANASGKLANSISYVVVNGTKLQIFGNDYIQYLQNGRRPTKGGGNGSLKKAIRQWIDDKGIIPDGISKDSLAFLITRKIHEEGATIYKAGGSDLLSSIFNEALQSSVEADFANLIVTEIQSEIYKLAA